jgi:hypothetical protein
MTLICLAKLEVNVEKFCCIWKSVSASPKRLGLDRRCNIPLAITCASGKFGNLLQWYLLKSDKELLEISENRANCFIAP